MSLDTETVKTVLRDVEHGGSVWLRVKVLTEKASDWVHEDGAPIDEIATGKPPRHEPAALDVDERLVTTSFVGDVDALLSDLREHLQTMCFQFAISTGGNEGCAEPDVSAFNNALSDAVASIQCAKDYLTNVREGRHYVEHRSKSA